jgi:hypothetical protein
MKNNLKHDLRILLLLALGIGGTSCSGWLLSDTAMETFMNQQLCPEDRIKISYVAIQPQDVFERPAPPAAVADDPGRLKVWAQKINDAFNGFKDLTLFDAAGCDAHLNYLCWNEDQGDRLASFCDPVDLDDTRARFGPFHLKASAGQSLRQRLKAGK